MDAIAERNLSAMRANARIEIAAKYVNGTTALQNLHEAGGYRAKFPGRLDGVLEAVTINTGGGVAGGDHLEVLARVEDGAALALTTATAERIYRTHGPATKIDVQLNAGPNAVLGWLPQASILFSGAHLARRIDVTATASSRVVVGETTIFGRTASRERVADVTMTDRWHIYRDGRLVFSEASRCANLDADVLARQALAGGANISTLLLALAPDLAERCDAVRARVAASGLLGGVSAWNGLLVVRLLGDRLDRMANCVRSVVSALDLIPLPAAWTH